MGAPTFGKNPVYSSALPFLSWEGSDACDCTKLRRKGDHRLRARVRLRRAPKQRRAVRGRAAIPYFPIASTRPDSPLFQLVRGTEANGVLPSLYVSGGLRKRRLGRSAGGLPPLLLLGSRPGAGTRRRQRQIMSLDQLVPQRRGTFRLDHLGLTREWADKEVVLLGRCDEATLELDENGTLDLSQAVLCALPLPVKHVREVHLGFRDDPPLAEDEPAWAPPDPGEGPQDAAAAEDEDRWVLPELVESLESVLAVVARAGAWFSRYRRLKAHDWEAKVAYLQDLLAQHGSDARFWLGGE